MLLKIYIYGYLNRIQSSRRLEREAQRNVELMWLTGRLAPDFKTIADFRQDNGAAIRKVCREFVCCAGSSKLFSEAHRGDRRQQVQGGQQPRQELHAAQAEARMQQLEQSIERYLAELDRADRDPAAGARGARRAPEGEDRQGQGADASARRDRRAAASSADRQISLTDPDARSMATSGRGTGIVGYNVQTAVDAKHHLIVAHEVTNVGHDRDQLATMAKQRAGGDRQTRADRAGRSRLLRRLRDPEVRAAGIDALVPKPLTSNSKAEGASTSATSSTTRSATSTAARPGSSPSTGSRRVEDGKTLHKYWTSACPSCPIKPRCTTSDYRRITRWEHEDVLEAMQARLDGTPEASRLRRQTVEHVFGTLKAWMGSTHFLTKTLPRVRTEMSLHVLAYNLKRMMNPGRPPLITAMRA